VSPAHQPRDWYTRRTRSPPSDRQPPAVPAAWQTPGLWRNSRAGRRSLFTIHFDQHLGLALVGHAHADPVVSTNQGGKDARYQVLPQPMTARGQAIREWFNKEESREGEAEGATLMRRRHFLRHCDDDSFRNRRLMWKPRTSQQGESCRKAMRVWCSFGRHLLRLLGSLQSRFPC
jgi:hypothetical protein